MLALPAVTPAQHKVVPWVMQIDRLALYHPSAHCNGISNIFVPQQFVRWNICAANSHMCLIPFQGPYLTLEHLICESHDVRGRDVYPRRVGLQLYSLNLVDHFILTG